MWDPSFPTRNRTCTPAVEVLHPNHWTVRDVPQEVLSCTVLPGYTLRPRSRGSPAIRDTPTLPAGCPVPLLITVAWWLLPAPPGRLTGRAQEVPGAWPAGQEGAEHDTLAAPAVYVACAAVTFLTTEMQPAQDPGLSLLLDNKYK